MALSTGARFSNKIAAHSAGSPEAIRVVSRKPLAAN